MLFPELFRDDVFRLETRKFWLRWPRQVDAGACEALRICHQSRDPKKGTSGFFSEQLNTDALIARARQHNLTGESLTLVVALKTGSREVIGLIHTAEQSGRPHLFLTLPDDWGQEAGAILYPVLDAFFSFTSHTQIRLAEELARHLPVTVRSTSETVAGWRSLERRTWQTPRAYLHKGAFALSERHSKLFE
jgi:hypothetical protein